MNIGEVDTFPWVKPNKIQSLKVVEEAAEVHAAWQEWKQIEATEGYYEARSYGSCPQYRALLDECADVIQATCNLLAALGVKEFRYVMEECRNRNAERGRYEVQEPDQKGEGCSE